MIDIRTTRGDDTVQLDVAGQLSFATVSELHAALRAEIDRTVEAPIPRLRIVLGEISSFDLAGIQLLYALCRESRRGDASPSEGGANRHPGPAVDVVAGACFDRLEKMLRFAGLAPIPCVRR